MPISRPGKQHSVSSAFSNKANPFDSDSDSEAPNTRPSRASSVPTKSKVGSGSGPDFENQSIQELESYAANKSEETTQKVDDCLRIAEMIREDATNTLVTLHQQGEQIHRTHQVAANIDQDLSRVNFLYYTFLWCFVNYIFCTVIFVLHQDIKELFFQTFSSFLHAHKISRTSGPPELFIFFIST